MKRLLPVVFALAAIIVALIPAQSAAALTIDGIVVEFDCAGTYAPNSYTLNYNRDNTGSGMEDTFLEIRDGVGVLLYSEDGASPLGAWTNPGGFFIPYHTAPSMNPITFHWWSRAGNGYEEVLVFQAFGECEGLPWAAPAGPTHPADFVQRPITCDVAVFDEPGGSPVGDNMLKAGQDWHVNPEPVMGPDGQHWTEVFVSGLFNGYIPTRCVG